jgi:prepilin-type N-terminal cleavage/methylation domain-containing protein|tara:strand:- start:1037 stop:1423 length:387 start_codon:yes stop_codon:yes gene_type:complete
MSIKQKKAFSLIEISVVLFIVAIFIAAVSSGRLLLDKSNDIKMQQALQAQLESQEYFEAKAFEVSVEDIISACSNLSESDNVIIDFLYSGNCCDGSNPESICCVSSANVTCEACGVGDNQPRCITPPQ